MTPPPPRYPPFTSLNPPYPSPPNLLSLVAAAVSAIVKYNNYRPFPLRKKRHLSFYPMHPSPLHSPPLTFTSPDSLSSFLSPRLRDNSLATWGSTPGTKTIHNLYHEISQGETSLLLADETLIRTVHVASINIRNSQGLVLVESKQLLSDGSVRERSRPLSEKMKPLESIEEAVARAVREELGESVVVEILDGSGNIRVEERESLSYPGLRARYVLHSVEAKVVQGLPEEGEFETEETGEDSFDIAGEESEGKAVTVKRHYWKWVDERDLKR
ncbi:hypothetical protein LUZ61_020382 [Rhynchospora tenuis]|uniref:Nudix hydrolase domain-containing protein n=1 Tax=Rhynchospora tenuis TaxID=198213 RepID=A0AAD6ENS7_9POAL|nr:hypothetical protein LUZ61_020382 [Rhynchospora tenuis]